MLREFKILRHHIKIIQYIIFNYSQLCKIN